VNYETTIILLSLNHRDNFRNRDYMVHGDCMIDSKVKCDINKLKIKHFGITECGFRDKKRYCLSIIKCSYQLKGDAMD
jgi:hypothetical protein